MPDIEELENEELENSTEQEDTPVATEDPTPTPTPTPPDTGFISLTEFNTYTGNYEDGEAVVALKATILNSAQEVVSNYLEYSIKSTSYSDDVSGIGNNRLYLFAQPVTAVSSVSINGQTLASTDYSIVNARYLKLASGVWPVGVENVHVEYTAGWSAQTFPELVKMVCLQIAALMLEEANGNIGITGKSFADNSRNFINYNNFDKWLKKIDSLRIVRLV